MNVLYITYDGLTDPLGQSQILPYLIGLSKHGYQFTILSFEKKEKLEKNEDLIRKITGENGINWVPLRFTKRPKGLSKLYDALRMKQVAYKLHAKHHFELVHCRSYIAADVGLKMKKKFGTKFFFDMRGFWADEKKDGGSWDQSKFLFRKVYQYYKKRESEYLRYADHVVVLTESGKKEMLTWPSVNTDTPFSVIPCCADGRHFTLTDARQKQEARDLLGFSSGDLVVSYLGSVGTWYMLDEMLDFFSQLKSAYANAKFLFITHTPPSLINDKIKEKQLDAKDFVITEASRNEVPVFIKASDINLSFIKPVYSKLSSSPTKLGEVLSMGIPMICNAGVGDVEKVVNDCYGGFVLQRFDKAAFAEAIEAIPGLMARQSSDIREKAMNYYSLEKGINQYMQAYRKTFGK